MKLLNSFIICCLAFVLSACGDVSNLTAYNDLSSSNHAVSELSQEPDAEVAKASQYLAYRHTLSVDVEPVNLPDLHQKIVSDCEKDTQFSCVVLDADLSTGNYSSSRIRLRLKREGVEYFSSLVSSSGEIASRSSSAEDLTARIFDTGKRIDQLKSYQQKLKALEAKPTIDIESLVKIASELSETQTQLEYLEGDKAQLIQRVETDILNINMTSYSKRSFLSPIGDALDDFTSEFADGIANVISSAAYIIPWAIFLLIGFFILRGCFRLLNRIRKD